MMMSKIPVKYKRNRETRTDGIKAWRVDRTFTVDVPNYPFQSTSVLLGNADTRASFYGEAR